MDIGSVDWDVGNGVAIGVGVALLLLGRRFLGLFVALVGFGLGHSLALESMGPEAGDQALALGAVVAVAGAVAVLVVRKVVSRFVGLVGGAYGGFLLGATLVLPDPIWGWVVIGVCAAVGFVAGQKLFDWTLLLASCVIGAGMIAEAAAWPPETARWAYPALLVGGALFQTLVFSKKKS